MSSGPKRPPETTSTDETTPPRSDEPELAPGVRFTLSRRGFLQASGATAGAGALASCRPERDPQRPRPRAVDQELTDPPVGPDGVTIELHVNGKRRRLAVRTDTTLADALRERLGLTGLKVGCNRGACGSCTVLLDGVAVNSCLMLAVDAHGRRVQTIEGLSRGKRLHPLQEAFVEKDALQCGYCTSGMIMASKALLDDKGQPTREEIQEGLSGNLCRCGCYPNIVEAVETVASGKTRDRGGES